jgi:DNA polymerase delta subunit 1
MHGNSRGRDGNGKRVSYGRGGNSAAGAGGKRFRGDDDNDEGEDFDSQLASMVDEGDDMQHDVAMMEEPEELVEDMKVDRIKRWQRPAAPPIDPTKENFVFQQIDIDNYVGKPLSGMPGAPSGPVPVMRMFGVTEKVLYSARFLCVANKY